eukprot:m.127443 g.127443  ORF g.127443 m.127443 type:complete len:73 (+) comp16705_c0_seq5:1315-1533(+)
MLWIVGPTPILQHRDRDIASFGFHFKDYSALCMTKAQIIGRFANSSTCSAIMSTTKQKQNKTDETDETEEKN